MYFRAKLLEICVSAIRTLNHKRKQQEFILEIRTNISMDLSLKM